MDDRELARGIAAGDERARRALFEAEGRRIWSLLYRLTGDYDQAHDLSQDTFVRAFRRIGQYGGAGSLAGWVRRIAVNLALDARRRTARRRIVPLDAARDVASPAREDAAGEVRDRVAAALDAIGEKYRVVLLMHDVEGYTHEEIARTLGIAAGSCRARLARARAKLRELLGDLKEER